MGNLLAGFAAFILAGFLLLSIVFFTEGSKRASFKALLLALTLPVPFLIAFILDNPVVTMVGIIVTLVTIFCLILLILPIKGRGLKYSNYGGALVDERDTIFSRNELIPGTKLYDDYYLKHPAKLEKDQAWRSEPGLLNPSALLFKKLAFTSAEASFDTVKLFEGLRDNKPESAPSELNGIEVNRFIKSWGKKLGATGVGITAMKDYHYYTHAGRGERYGKTIKQEHPYGIVFLVEMDYEMVSSAPHSPVVMESASQYLRSAAVATQVAVMIRKLGYTAKTHIDGNYDVICPLVAKDAGLGEIGRNGLLISDEYGPRVRISIVTTDLPLQIDQPQSDSSVTRFCSVCEKCADNCPAQSIPKGPGKEINGALKWQLDQESCFTYWNHCGTDCARCMSTCPYSHRNSWFHNIIRKGIRNNLLFLHLAIFLDDLFYGKRPSSVKNSDLMV